MMCGCLMVYSAGILTLMTTASLLSTALPSSLTLARTLTTSPTPVSHIVAMLNPADDMTGNCTTDCLGYQYDNDDTTTTCQLPSDSLRTATICTELVSLHVNYTMYTLLSPSLADPLLLPYKNPPPHPNLLSAG